MQKPQGGTPNEFGAVLTLSLGFGLVGLDRFIINPLFPVIARDLNLGYQHIGMIAGILALTWGISAIFSGRLADRLGLKAVMIPAVLIFSALVGATGLAAGLFSLLLIRGLMGFAEGAFVPASIVATQLVSHPKRLGLNVGLQQMAAPIFGLALAPILATQLLQILPSWHWVFVLVALPGLLIALALCFVPLPRPRTDAPEPAHPWRALLANSALIATAAAMVCWLSSLMTLAALTPSYLTDYQALSLQEMGFVMSGLGLGSLLGLSLLPALADWVGFKRVLLAAAVLKVLALAALIMLNANSTGMFGLLFVIGMMGSGATAITVGPLTTGAAPAALAATATGLVVGAGEIVGGALAPVVSGAAAQNFGISVIPIIALVATSLGLLATLAGVREPTRSAIPA